MRNGTWNSIHTSLAKVVKPHSLYKQTEMYTHGGRLITPRQLVDASSTLTRAARRRPRVWSEILLTLWHKRLQVTRA